MGIIRKQRVINLLVLIDFLIILGLQDEQIFVIEVCTSKGIPPGKRMVVVLAYK